MAQEKHTFSITEDSTLLEFLLGNLKSKSRNNIKNLMKTGFCALDGEIVTKFDYPLRNGQTLTISYENAVRAALPFDILYEDDHIIVIDKPAGLLCIANEHEKKRTAYRFLSEYMKSGNKHGKVFIIHRLDRDTSGIVIFAKDEKTKEEYQNNWDSLVVHRRYTAVCDGIPPEPSGTITSYLRETKDHRVYVTENSHHSKKATTRYTVIKSNNKYSLLDIEIDTGRKNQIRVQLSELGFPVTGDKKYGSESNPIKRLALHASGLEFNSPQGKHYSFKSKYPKNFSTLCN